jgi:hypothetical protein
MKNLVLLKGFNKDWKILAVAGVLSFGFVAAIGFFDGSHAQVEAASVDTLIPAGFILIPIEVQNYESLDSLLGQYGVVDLFRGEGGKGTLVARNIKILRAPQNPAHFAVLAPENEATRILSQQGSFYVALKRPNEVGTHIVNDSSHSARRIQFDGE